MVRNLEPGRYNITDMISKMALETTGSDDRHLHAVELSEAKRQQWEFRHCGLGFIIESVHNSYLFVTVRDSKSLHREQSAEVVTGHFPTCWEVEILADGGKDSDPGTVLARIQLPYTQDSPVTMGFKNGYQKGAPPLLGNNQTIWRLRPVGKYSKPVVESVESKPVTTKETISEGGVKKTVITTMSVETTTRTITRVVPGNA